MPIWDQMSEELKNKIKVVANYQSANAAQDEIALLLLARGFCCQFDDQRQGIWALQQAKKQAFLFIQKEGTSTAKYYEEFMSHINGVEEFGGQGGQEPGPIRAKMQIAHASRNVVDLDAPTPAELDAAKEAAKEDFIAMMFLSGADS